MRKIRSIVCFNPLHHLRRPLLCSFLPRRGRAVLSAIHQHELDAQLFHRRSLAVPRTVDPTVLLRRRRTHQCWMGESSSPPPSSSSINYVVDLWPAANHQSVYIHPCMQFNNVVNMVFSSPVISKNLDF